MPWRSVSAEGYMPAGRYGARVPGAWACGGVLAHRYMEKSTYDTLEKYARVLYNYYRLNN